MPCRMMALRSPMLLAYAKSIIFYAQTFLLFGVYISRFES